MWLTVPAFMGVTCHEATEAGFQGETEKMVPVREQKGGGPPFAKPLKCIVHDHPRGHDQETGWDHPAADNIQ